MFLEHKPCLDCVRMKTDWSRSARCKRDLTISATKWDPTRLHLDWQGAGLLRVACDEGLVRGSIDVRGINCFH